MSKMSQTIAILGVVAGLGVAALPLSTYAAPADQQTASTPAEGADMTVDSATVPIELKLGEYLMISTSRTAADEKVQLLSENVSGEGIDTAATGADYASKGFNVNVVSNNTAGFYVGIKGTGTTDHETDLWSGTDAIAAGTLAGDTSTWGYKVTPATGETDTDLNATSSASLAWVAVEKKSKTIYTQTGLDKTAADKTKGRNIPVTFGAKIATDQAAGTYNGQVTFTATAGVETPAGS